MTKKTLTKNIRFSPEEFSEIRKDDFNAYKNILT